MSPHRSRSPLRRDGPKRGVTWSNGPNGSVTNITTSTQGIFTTGQAAGADFTVVRLHGSLLVYLRTAGGAVAEGFAWAMGVCIVSQNAFGAGVASIPSPITDIDWGGWFVHEQGMLITPEAALANYGPEFERRPIDSKAMRKMHVSDTVVACFETTESGDGSAMDAFFESRMLVKLQ